MLACFNPMVVRLLITGVVMFGVWPAAASAQCRLEILRPPSEVRFNYDPFQPTLAAEQIRVTLRNPSAEPCLGEIAFLDDQGRTRSQLDIAGTGLALTITPAEGVAATSEAGVYRLTVAANAEREVAFDLAVEGDRVLEAGLYPQDLVLRVRDEGGLSPGRDTRVPVALRSLPRAQLNIAGALGSFGEGSSISRIDFGVAETGKSERVFVQSRTNAPARIRISSANKGLLQLVAEPETVGGLTYTAVLANTPLDLTRPAFVDVDPPRTYQGASLELVLTLGSVGGARAGAYSDELTFEISTL